MVAAKRARRTEFPPLTEAQRQLAAAYFPNAVAISRFHSRNWPRRADAYRDAAIDGLIKAARDFDPDYYPEHDRGYLFIGMLLEYASKEIKNANRTLGNPKRYPGEKAWSLEWSDISGDETSLSVPARLPEETVDFEGILSLITKKQARVFRLRFAEDMNFCEIARALGVTRQNAHKADSRGMETLRESPTVRRLA